MPKIPRGMFKREGRGYYTRRWIDGKDRWVSLGRDFDEACRRLRALEKRDLPVANLSVRDAAQKWLETYVATNSAERNRAMAAQRVRDYFEPFMGYKLLARVEKEDLRAMRLWLERQGKKTLNVRHILATQQQMLSHSSIVTTQRYAWISDDMVRREVERLEGLAS